MTDHTLWSSHSILLFGRAVIQKPVQYEPQDTRLLLIDSAAMQLPVSFEDVQLAANRIAGHVHRTPVMTSATLDSELEARILFKCENLQRVGAFKARGAVNAVFSLTEEQAAAGVITHSSGNHGAALAYAASLRGIRSTVVIPTTAPELKVEAIVGYGAQVERCLPDERGKTMAKLTAATGARIVHPFNDPDVIAGQGTATMELLDDHPDIDVVVAPIGGGGLLSGAAVVAHHYGKGPVIGAEPELVDDANRSLTSGVLQPAVPDTGTLADGLQVGLGELTFAILSGLSAEIVLVGEDDLVAAALFHLERMKLVVEPSGAAGLAAVRNMTDAIRERTVGVIISGGNTDLGWLSRV